MNATTIEAYALSKGIDTAYVNMDNATKVGLAMEMFLEKTAYAAGNYAKENKTFAGSFNTLKAATSNFLSGAGGIEDVATSLISFGEILIESITNMAPTIVEGLINLTQTLLPQIPILIESLMPAVLEGAVSLINGLVAIFPALMTMIQQNLPTIVKGGMTIVKTLLTTILNMLPQILQMGITLLLELVKGISEALPELIPIMVRVIMDMVNILLDNIDVIISAALRIIMALAEGLIKYVPEMISRIPQIIKSIVEALKQGVSDFINIGINLIKGLWQGISDTKTWLVNKIKGIGKTITSAIKSVFGIHSPSRVFRDEIGKNLALGLGEGFDKEMDNVYRDMQRAIDLETGKMSANVQASGTYQMAMAGMPTFNLLDNSEHSTQLVVNGKVLAEVVNTENRNREVAAS